MSNMAKHKVTVTFDVPYYGEVEVEGKDLQEAKLNVMQALSTGQEIAHPIFKGIKIEPDMFQVEMMRVVDRSEMPRPVPTKQGKGKDKPTFNDNG